MEGNRTLFSTDVIARWSNPAVRATASFEKPQRDWPCLAPLGNVPGELICRVNQSHLIGFCERVLDEEPPQPRPTIPRERTQEELARQIFLRRHTLQIGATVFDHRLSIVHWRHPDTGEFYKAVCGFDVGLLAGVGRFSHEGETYDLMLVHSHYESRQVRSLPWWGIPDLSAVPEGSIIFKQGNQKDPLGTAPITLLRELITTEKSRLTLYQENSTRYQQAAAAWEKTHPVPPRDETFWLRPHRGSRYLADPKPEATAR